MEITAYPLRNYLDDDDVILFDGQSGTKIIPALALAQDLFKKSYSPAQNGTLTTSWSGSGPWTQTINIAGITATDRPIIQCNYDPPNEASKKLMIKNWGYIDKAETVEGGIKFTCKFKKPTIAMPFVVKEV